MATVALKSFKPKRGNKTSFWYSLGIEDEKTARRDAGTGSRVGAFSSTGSR